jgi:hypothetical protein
MGMMGLCQPVTANKVIMLFPTASHRLGFGHHLALAQPRRESTVKQAQCNHQTTGTYNPHLPINRANPCPEVTDQFCRLPLPTLFYEPEAVNLGDLLRIWVRLGARGISRSVNLVLWLVTQKPTLNYITH